MAKKARLTIEMSVSLTPEISQALEIATEFSGMKPSQYARQAVLKRLVSQGFLEHPMKRLAAANAAKA
jgi:hypothetical protein